MFSATSAPSSGAPEIRFTQARKHDENWTTTEGVQKGGKDINTFRGKYGEDKGG